MTKLGVNATHIRSLGLRLMENLATFTTIPGREESRVNSYALVYSCQGFYIVTL